MAYDKEERIKDLKSNLKLYESFLIYRKNYYDIRLAIIEIKEEIKRLESE